MVSGVWSELGFESPKVARAGAGPVSDVREVGEVERTTAKLGCVGEREQMDVVGRERVDSRAPLLISLSQLLKRL